MGLEQTYPGQIGPESMALRQINLKEMGFGKMGPAEINTLRNRFLHTIFKIAQSHFVSK